MGQHHLIYHITPKGMWRENLEELRKYIHVFDGVKMVVVYFGDGLEQPKEVAPYVEMFDEVFSLRNSVEFRETPSLFYLLDQLERKASDGAAFFGHTKGVSHTAGEGEKRISAIKLWTKACYEKNLEDIALVDETLKWFDTVGCFRQQNLVSPGDHLACPWCYAGTFFWFNVAALWRKDWRKSFKLHRYGAEFFPGFAFPIERSACLFGESTKQTSLYLLENIEQLLCTQTV